MCELCLPDLTRDLLTLRGLGVFTVFMVRNGRAFHFDDHWGRIMRSCRDAHIATSSLPSAERALWAVRHALGESEDARSMVRILVTAGDTLDGKHGVGDPKMLVLVDPMPAINDDPLRLALQHGGRKRPEIKMVGPYADLMLDLQEVQQNHCQDILYFSDEPATGMRVLTETTCGNVFFVTKDNKLITPAKKVLAGVTRSIVLDLAGGSNIFEWSGERCVDSDRSLAVCVEAFRTASISGIVPIRSIGDYQFRVGAGTRTEKIKKLYADYVDGYFS